MPNIKLKFVLELELQKKDGKLISDELSPESVTRTVEWPTVPHTGDWVWFDTCSGEPIEMQVHTIIHMLDKGEVEISLDPQFREVITDLLKSGWKADD
jgi:hypothetical protein